MASAPPRREGGAANDGDGEVSVSFGTTSHSEWYTGITCLPDGSELMLGGFKRADVERFECNGS